MALTSTEIGFRPKYSKGKSMSCGNIQVSEMSYFHVVITSSCGHLPAGRSHGLFLLDDDDDDDDDDDHACMHACRLVQLFLVCRCFYIRLFC